MALHITTIPLCIPIVAMRMHIFYRSVYSCNAKLPISACAPGLNFLNPKSSDEAHLCGGTPYEWRGNLCACTNHLLPNRSGLGLAPLGSPSWRFHRKEGRASPRGSFGTIHHPLFPPCGASKDISADSKILHRSKTVAPPLVRRLRGISPLPAPSLNFSSSFRRHCT